MAGKAVFALNWREIGQKNAQICRYRAKNT
jgi:hypothetical protein